MNALDKIIGYISPAWALKRDIVRYQRALYDAADLSSRFRPRPKPTLASPSEEIRQGRQNLLMVSRDLDRNNSWVTGLFDTIANNIVGEGFPPRIKVNRLRGEGFDDSLSDAASEVWNEWGLGVDVNGDKSFEDLEWECERELWAAGEYLVVLGMNPAPVPGKVPLVLDMVESERLSNLEVEGRNGKRIVHGIEYDSVGRRVAYHIWPEHPGEMMSKYEPTRVPAENVIHVFENRRLKGTRGIPACHGCANNLQALAKCFDHELTRIQIASAFALLHKRGGLPWAPPKANAGDPVPAKDDAGNPLGLIEGGIFLTGGPSDSLESAGPNINPAFKDFVYVNLRACAVGFGTSYEFMARDFTQANMSAARVGSLEDRKSWRRRQKSHIRRGFQKIFKEWRRISALSGIAPFSSEPIERFKAEWRPPGWDWFDPEADIGADKEAVKAGFKSIQKVCAEHGDDFFEIMDQNSEANEYAKEKGMFLDVFPPDPMEMKAREDEANINAIKTKAKVAS